MGSATGGGSPSSPGGKGGSSGGYNPGAEPSPSYGGGAPSTPNAFGFGPPQSPGGKGGINQPRQGPGPGQFGYGGSDYGGSPNSPGGKGGMPSQFPQQQQQQQQLNPYQQQYQQQFMPPSQQQFSMQSPRPYQRQQQPYNLANSMQTMNLGQQQRVNSPGQYGYQTPMPRGGFGGQNPQQMQQPGGEIGIGDFMRQQMQQQPVMSQDQAQAYQTQLLAQNPQLGQAAQMATQQPQGASPGVNVAEEYNPNQGIDPAFQGMSQADRLRAALDDSGMGRSMTMDMPRGGQNPYQRAGLGQLMGRSQQQYFSPQQMQQDPYMNYVQNQQQAMQQQAMRSSQQQQYQAAQEQQQRAYQQQATQAARRAEQTGTWDGYSPVQF